MVNTYKPNIKENIFIKMIEYIFVFVTMLQCNSIFIFAGSIHTNKVILNLIWQILLIFLICINITTLNNTRLNLFILLFSFISILFFIYNFIIYPTFFKTYIFRIFVDPILLILLFSFTIKRKKIHDIFFKFENTVVLFSIFSLIGWLLFILHVPTNLSVYTQWGAHHSVPSYFGLDFFPQIKSLFIGLNWVRNSGIFAEASMFAYVLIFAILIELFMKDKSKVLTAKSLILLLTIISTASTTGILVAIPAFIYSALLKSNNKNTYKLLLLLILPILIIFLKMVLFSKLGHGSSIGSSYDVRSDDIHAGFMAWLSHPLLGGGLGNKLLLQTNMSPWRFIAGPNPAISVGFTTILAQGGILLALFYILPAILISKYSKKLLGIALFSFIPFIFVICQGFYIYIMFLSYFWAIILSTKSRYLKLK